MTDRLIRCTTALAVLMVAGVAAVISYAYELVTTHGETGVTAHLLPFTVDGLIWPWSAPSSSSWSLIRKHHQAGAGQATGTAGDVAPGLAQRGPPVVHLAPTLEQMVRDLHAAGRSQRSIARDLSLGRRKVKQIIDTPAVC